jgi:hypothetical protein
MGIANYTNLSELMNKRLETGQAISIAELVEEAARRHVILASEGELADRYDLENGYIDLVNALYRAGHIRPEPGNETESNVIRLYESGKLAESGFGSDEGDRFLHIKWIALTAELPIIVNLPR